MCRASLLEAVTEALIAGKEPNTQKILAVVADGRLRRRADLDQLLAGKEENRMPGE